MSPSIQVGEALGSAAARAGDRAAECLLRLQNPQGYWWFNLTADTTLESDYILLELWLHPPESGVWNPPNRERIDRAVESILARQLPDGGFNVYPGGPADVSATVKAYFALKLAGVSVRDPRMALARDRVLALGGIQKANGYVKINLSLFGLYPRKHCPSVPPEMILLPGKFIYRMSSWTRAIVVPLAIIHSFDPARPVPAGFSLEELFLRGGSFEYRHNEKFFTLRNYFFLADRLLKFYERHPVRWLRRRAVEKCRRWMLERMRYTDGLGAIYPPMMYSIMALDLLGYPPDHPDRAEAQAQFERLMQDDGEQFYFQPCFSVVWDTAIAAFALGESGHAPAAALTECADWLLTKEVRCKGDWSVSRPHTAPSGWYFEFANEFYPDIDDTGMVLLALGHARASNAPAQAACLRRAAAWLLAMQSKDGGWAAFDVDNNWQLLSYMPFADHNAMLDPTCPDITGRVLEAICVAAGLGPEHPAVRRATGYLLKNQEADGSWRGRWGVNYIYGTFLALRGLRAAGVSDREAAILRACEWLRSVQNADGGWGESCASYEQGCLCPAESTASQTAWALLGLLAGGDSGSLSVQQGIEYLLRTQRGNGSWHEDLATGAGFPGVFYLTYHLYRLAFPLLALATYLKAAKAPDTGGNGGARGRL
ncbi:MAG: squalene--hopene cyclase [Bryobacteraceae bacterium]|jgi:squalene-hopene/tetraprenyl-beta-curcumene cyclase